MSAQQITSICAGDPVFQANNKALIHRFRQRKITDTEFARLHDYLVQAAVRRHQSQPQAR
jgi:hypothetical protein